MLAGQIQRRPSLANLQVVLDTVAPAATFDRMDPFGVAVI